MKTSNVVGKLPFAVGDCNGVVRGGRLLVFGGGEGESFHDEILAVDPSGAVAEIGRMPYRSRGHQVVDLDGTIYVLGGFNGEATLDVLWELDLDAGTARRRAPMPSSNSWFGATAHHGGIAVIGGFTIPDGYLDGAYLYDPAADAWSRADAVVDATLFPKGRVGANALLSVGDRLMTVGGADSFDHEAGRSTALPLVAAFDPGTRDWAHLGDLDEAREGIAVARDGDRIYLVGGMDESSPTPSRRVERLDPATGRVEMVGELQLGRLTPVAGVVEGRLIVAGGVTKPLAEMTDSVEVLDLE